MVWRRLGDIPSFFLSNNFQIVDSTDNTKGIVFETSGITSGNFRTLKIQDSGGTIAYLTDLDGKVDLSAFVDYTANTAPSQFVLQTDFDSYSANTLSLIGTKQDKLTAGDYISISGNVISVTGITENLPIQLVDSVGGVNINKISPTAINWTTQEYTGTSLNFTGGSRIYILEDGSYEISYVLNINSDTNKGQNIGTVMRKNGSEDITPMSSTSVSLDYKNDSGTNVMTNYLVDLDNGDYVELIAFRIGKRGTVYSVGNGSWIKIQKK